VRWIPHRLDESAARKRAIRYKVEVNRIVAVASASLLVTLSACGSSHAHRASKTDFSPGPSPPSESPSASASASASAPTPTGTKPSAVHTSSSTPPRPVAAPAMHFDPANTDSAYISADGSRIVFGALQTVSGQKHWHVIARNPRTNGLSRVDISPSGKLANGDAQPAGLSADGRYVLFTTKATNFGTGGTLQTYERDLTTHRTVLVSVPPAGVTWRLNTVAVSGDGRFVVFDVFATKYRQVYLRNVVARTTTLVTHDDKGGMGDNESLAADVSPDGSKVVFGSFSSNLVPDDTNGKPDVFMWTRASGAIARISLTSDGKQLTEGSSAPHFTTDGGYVVYSSDAQLTSDACKGDNSSPNTDSFNGENAYVLNLSTHTVTHQKQNCQIIADTNLLYGSDAGTTLALGILFDVDEVFVRRNGTQRTPNYVAATPTSITANGRFVGINHYDPVDKPPSDKDAGALIWDLSQSKPAPAWTVRITS
jgi:hypothetical protein